MGTSDFNLHLDVRFNFLNSIYILRYTENANTCYSDKLGPFASSLHPTTAGPACQGAAVMHAQLGHAQHGDSFPNHVSCRAALPFLSCMLVREFLLLPGP